MSDRHKKIQSKVSLVINYELDLTFKKYKVY
jgi:hypothetical protein